MHRSAFTEIFGALFTGYPRISEVLEFKNREQSFSNSNTNGENKKAQNKRWTMTQSPQRVMISWNSHVLFTSDYSQLTGNSCRSKVGYFSSPDFKANESKIHLKEVEKTFSLQSLKHYYTQKPNINVSWKFFRQESTVSGGFVEFLRASFDMRHCPKLFSGAKPFFFFQGNVDLTPLKNVIFVRIALRQT